MSRLTDAWAALCGRPKIVENTVEVEKIIERLVPAGDSIVTVFEARSRTYGLVTRWSGLGAIPPAPCKPKWHGNIYLTCAQGFAECGGEDADLVQRKALVVGGKAYLFDGLVERDIQPKPKRAKGARA